MQKFQKMIKYLGTAISVVMVGLAILLGFSVRWMNWYSISRNL